MGPGPWLMKRKGAAAGAPAFWEDRAGPGWGVGAGATVILERPDSEYERGRWWGLRRCQVGLLREVNSNVYLAVVALNPKRV